MTDNIFFKRLILEPYNRIPLTTKVTKVDEDNNFD